jgi:hypothetical protein
VNQIIPLLVLNLILTFAVGFIDWRAHVGGLVAGIVGGYLIEGFGRDRSTERLTSAFAIVVVLAAAALLTAVGTARIHAAFPDAF